MGIWEDSQGPPCMKPREGCYFDIESMKQLRCACRDTAHALVCKAQKQVTYRDTKQFLPLISLVKGYLDYFD